MFELHIELEQMGREPKGLGEPSGLVVVPRPRYMTVHFLETDDVRILVLNDLDDPVEAVSPVASPDSLVNVVAQEAHGHPSLDSWLPTSVGVRGIAISRRLPSGEPPAVSDSVQATCSSRSAPAPSSASCLALPPVPTSIGRSSDVEGMS